MKKIVLAVIAGTFILGCSQNQKSVTDHKSLSNESAGMHHSTGTGTEVVFRTSLKEEVGNPATCPVMGTKFNIKETTQVALYKGKTYPFCCPGCSNPFKQGPEEYIQ